MWAYLAMGSLFCSTGFCICFCAPPYRFVHCSSAALSEAREHGTPILLFVFFRIAFAIWGLWWFHVNLGIICSSSVKNVMNILTGIALNLYTFLGSMDSLVILITPTDEHGISFRLDIYIIFSFLHQNYIAFRV